MTQQTSKRRTGRITQPSTITTAQPATSTEKPAKQKRGYVAVECAYIHESVNEIAMQATEDIHIEGVNGAKVDIKAGQRFYLARAASIKPEPKDDEEPGRAMFYIVLCGVIGKKCSCAANKPCKHEIRIAAKEAARKAEASKAEPTAYDLVADLIDPQLPEMPAQSPEETAAAEAAAAREELAALEAELLAVRAKEIQASREAAGRDACESDVITNGSIDFAQERVGAAKQAEKQREAAPLNGRGGFSILRAL